MSKRQCYSTLFLVALLFSCNKETAFDCVKKTGEVVTEERFFTGFRKIIVEDNIDLILLENLSEKVIVEAGENLLPKIEISQDGTILTIENKNTCNWVRTYDIPIKVYVGANHVKEIIQNGYGKLETVEEIDTDTLSFQALTFGDVDLKINASLLGFIADEKVTVKLAGSANKANAIVFRNAQVDISGLISPFTQVQQTSLLDVKAYSSGIIQSKINGKGNLICYGNPTRVEFTQQSEKGTLKLIP